MNLRDTIVHVYAATDESCIKQRCEFMLQSEAYVFLKWIMRSEKFSKIVIKHGGRTIWTGETGDHVPDFDWFLNRTYGNEPQEAA